MTNIVPRAAAGAAALASIAAVGASSAQAAPAFHCEASAVRVAVGGQGALEPVVTGRAGDCTTASGTPSVALPSLLSAQALTADTTFDPGAATGTATGGVARLS